MAQDLVGYLFKVRANITPAQAAHARKLAAYNQREFLKDYPNAGHFAHADRKAVLKRHPWVEWMMDNCEEDAAALWQRIEALNPTLVIKNFLELVRKGTRDSCVRPDPDNPQKTLVFTGDNTYGDAPQGAGYQAAEEFLELGIGDTFGMQ